MYLSEEQLQEILFTIKASSNNHDWWTIAATVISAIAAVVAIFISIHIAKQQDKITLYEKRLECYLQFVGLKNFVEFMTKEENLPVGSTENDKIIRLQNKYMDIHNLFVDKEFQRYRFDAVRRNAYIWNCLEKDQAMLTSLLFLSEKATESALCEVKESLLALISELFKLPITHMDTSKIASVSTTFVEKFAKITSYDETLKSLLQLGKNEVYESNVKDR